MAETRRLKAIVRSLESRVGDVPPESIATISGGADSAVAAWLTARHGAERAVHVDHGQPGSHLMREAAKAIADRLDLELQIVAVDASGDSEGALRAMRYEALSHVGDGAQPIVLGHTADDQAETVVINLMRGAGVTGLAGMPIRRGRYLRPLLRVWRSETLELATLLELPWRDDQANRDLRHLRNRIRLALIPEIERHSAGEFRSTLVRTAESARDELAVVEGQRSRIPIERSDRGFRFARGAAEAAGPELTATILRREIAVLRAGLPPDRAVVDRAIDVIEGRRSSAQLGSRLVVRALDALVTVAREDDPADHVPSTVELEPGSHRWGRFRFDVALVERRPVVPLSTWGTVIPVASGGGATVRAAQPEEIRSAGERQRPGPWPAVDLDGRLVWIPGVRRPRWQNREVDRYLCAVAEEESDWARFEP